MSKELKALSKVELALKISLTLFEDIFVTCPEQIKENTTMLKKAIKLVPIIETALKRIPELEKEIEDTHKAYSMSIEKHIKDENEYIEWAQKGGYDQKKLKALEIIKDLLSTIFDEISFNDEKNEILFSDHYGVVFTRQYKNKETYDLLKKVLL